jgi:hypothetical protein
MTRPPADPDQIYAELAALFDGTDTESGMRRAARLILLMAREIDAERLRALIERARDQPSS